MDTETLENLVTGKTMEELATMRIDFDTAYPIVENGIVVGVVDGNYPDEYNHGNWEIVDSEFGQYAEIEAEIE